MKSDTLYVAHTANDAVDVIDCGLDKYLRSIPNLPGVAGVLVSNEKDLVFTSNRGETTVGIFHPKEEKRLEKVTVGGMPNGLAFDSSQNQLLVANVAKPGALSPVTLSMVDVGRKKMIADVRVPGRTRWTVFDPELDRFYVNIAKPPQIIVVDSDDPSRIEASYEIPATGPHGLDLDVDGRRLFCACDEGGLFTIDLESDKVSKASDLIGPPDVIFYNHKLEHLYVAIANPGVIQLFDTKTMRSIENVKTEPGAHTIAFHRESGKVYAFSPESHRALVYADT